MPKTLMKTEIPYKMGLNGMLLTPCPFLPNIELTIEGLGIPGPKYHGEDVRPMVGSAYCLDCKFHLDCIRAMHIVICSHPITD